jgi:hypothetical protein
MRIMLLGRRISLENKPQSFVPAARNKEVHLRDPSNLLGWCIMQRMGIMQTIRYVNSVLCSVSIKLEEY